MKILLTSNLQHKRDACHTVYQTNKTKTKTITIINFKEQQAAKRNRQHLMDTVRGR